MSPIKVGTCFYESGGGGGLRFGLLGVGGDETYPGDSLYEWALLMLFVLKPLRGCEPGA